MNRRQFLPLVAALPLAVKAVVAIVPVAKEDPYRGDSTSFARQQARFDPITPETMGALIERAPRRQLDEYVRQSHAAYGL